MNASLGMDLVRTIFATVDNAIYSLISVLYELLLQLSNVSIFTNENINDVSVRIYSFLGIIMLFKATFSLINYLINPETLSDKTNGAGNLVKNIIITLFLIIIVPYCFDLLYKAQSAILNDQLIPRLILGTSNGDLDNTKIIMDKERCKDLNNEFMYAENFKNNGDYIAMITFRPFYQIYSEMDTTSIDLNIYCRGASSSEQHSKVSNLLTSNIYNAEDATFNTGKYIIDYSFFLSTACGVLVMLLLLEFCFDVAMRCVKLGFLEIAAPIAIISFIDPKSAKSGAFSKWLKEVFGTWARLFIRLAILYFAIYFIGLVNENIDMYMDNGIWVMLFLIIGALLFAKKAVSLIEDIFGIKLDHSIQLNPFKKIQDQALGGKQILGGGAGAVGSVGGAIAGAKAGFQVGAAGRGALLGAISGFNNGKGDLKNPFGTGMNKTYKELTGNDMVNLTPAKVIMGMSSKGIKSVNQVGDHLKVARGRLNEAHTSLNEQSHISVEHSTTLSRLQSAGYNIDMKNLSGSRQSAEKNIDKLNTAKDVNEIMYDEAKTKYENANNEYEHAKNFIDEYQNKPINERNLDEYNKNKEIIQKLENGELDQLRNNMLTSQQQVENIQKDIANNQTIIDSIDNYQESKKRENEIRGEISKIEKEISTLSDEKKQRERFWQVDTSPKKSLQEAMDANPVVKKEENK